MSGVCIKFIISWSSVLVLDIICVRPYIGCIGYIWPVAFVYIALRMQYLASRTVVFGQS